MDSLEHNNIGRDGDGTDADRLVKSIVKTHFDERLSNRLEKKLRDEYNVTREEGPRSVKKIGILTFLFIIFLLVTFFFFYNKTQSGVNDAVLAHLSSPHASSSYLTRGSKELSINDGLRKEAALAFADRDYEKSIGLLLQIESSQEISEEDLFYIGLSYLYIRPIQYGEAVQVLERALDHSDLYTEEIQWYLLLAYLGNKDEDRALELGTHILINNSDHYRESEIKGLLQLL